MTRPITIPPIRRFTKASRHTCLCTFNMYVRNELKYQTDLLYKPTNYGEISPAWDQHHNIDGNQIPWPDVVQDLHDAMTQNPAAAGTFGQRLLRSGDAVLRHRIYARSHGPRSVPARASYHTCYFDSGHMVYLHAAALLPVKIWILRFGTTRCFHSPSSPAAYYMSGEQNETDTALRSSLARCSALTGGADLRPTTALLGRQPHDRTKIRPSTIP